MTEQAFASIWRLSYSDFDFLKRFGLKSQVMVACQLLYFRQRARFPADRSDLNPDVIAYVADQLGTADDFSYTFSSDTARRQRAGIINSLDFVELLVVTAPTYRPGCLKSLVGGT